MKCGDYDEQCERMALGPGAVGLQLLYPGERGVLAFAGRVPRRPARPVVVGPPHDRRAGDLLPTDGPFMNEMDEISYWIHTKRAPCLMNYDNLIKKQSEEAQCSKTLPEEVQSPKKKKKKRKLSVLDCESMSSEKQQNVYFEVSQRQSQPLVDSCQSDSIGSDVDFNIKNTSIRDKRKRVRVQKSSRTRTHKKTKLVSSTPKTTVHLRRSLRQAKQTHNNPLSNNSFEVINTLVSNGHTKKNDGINQKQACKVNKSTQILGAGDRDVVDTKRNTGQRSKGKNTTYHNGEFEDLSDVSGFTANYIRSTKVQSGKTPRKLRCKTSRTLLKESHSSPQNDKMVLCVNKTTNTGANVLNCSTDSSQNVINLISNKNNDTSGKMDKGTSLLKFVDTRAKSKEGASNKQKIKNNLNVSFQSQSSGTSRYPKRYKNNSDEKTNNSEVNIRTKDSKTYIEFSNSDKKENPLEDIVTRTRSGRNANFTVHPKENSVLLVSNSTEQVSSMVSVNVASSNVAQQQKKRRTTRAARGNTTVDKSGQSVRQDSLRDKSGFAACFSESDDDSLPLMQRKFFCN